MSKPVYVSGMPAINLNVDALLFMIDRKSLKTDMQVSIDPKTGVAMVSVFHDDNNGNRVSLLSIPLAELRALVRDYKNREAEAPSANSL